VRSPALRTWAFDLLKDFSIASGALIAFVLCQGDERTVIGEVCRKAGIGEGLRSQGYLAVVRWFADRRRQPFNGRDLFRCLVCKRNGRRTSRPTNCRLRPDYAIHVGDCLLYKIEVETRRGSNAN
jgi:hypothetical protein